MLPDGGNAMPFLRAAMYVYIFLMAMVAIRALFHYSRWVFPISEYRHTRSKALRHRAILSALTLGLIGTVLYDVLRAAFSG